MRPVNLLPPDTARRSVRSTTVAGVRFPPSPLALGAVAILLLISVLLGLMFVRERSKVETRRETLAAVQKQLAATPEPAQMGAVDAAAARLAALSSAAAARIAWDSVLRDVSRAVPSDAWLESLNAKPPAASTPGTTAAPAAVPTAFTATGYTYSQTGVARVLTRLALVPALTNVQLQSSVVSEIAGRRVVKFTVLADVDPAAATS